MRTTWMAAGAALIAAIMTCPALAWDPETDEESAGGSVAFQINSPDKIYGISLGSGSWIRGTPVFGDFFLSLFQNGIEDASYSGIGMTVRVMPHWAVAPFAGGGGSYNYSLSQASEDEAGDENTTPGAAGPLNRGDSYWAWHGETGLRIWTGGTLGLLEVSGRYVANTLEGGDRNYWLIGISIGDRL